MWWAALKHRGQGLAPGGLIAHPVGSVPRTDSIDVSIGTVGIPFSATRLRLTSASCLDKERRRSNPLLVCDAQSPLLFETTQDRSANAGAIPTSLSHGQVNAAANQAKSQLYPSFNVVMPHFYER